jgi:chorismate-pyruvate lyase
VREVRLFKDNKAVVFAKSVIPFLTSRYGYPELGAIGGKPLGELIFQSELFIKQSCKFAKFTFNKKEFVWGRRINYLVNGYPFSIMEVFL